MTYFGNIYIIFKFFAKTLVRSKKTKFFVLLSLVPTLIFLLINGLKLLYNTDPIQGSSFFENAGMIFFFKLYIQLISLLFGASVIKEEIENKTLVYLNTSPVSKSSIVSGKFAASILVSYLSFVTGSSLLFIATNLNKMLSIEHILILLSLEFAGFISILAYGSLFLLMGVGMKKSTILGVFYIFGWEGIVRMLPGSAQKLSLMFYINSLTPIKIPKDKGLLSLSINSPDYLESLIILIFLTAIFFLLSIYIFKKKEYTLADHT